MAHASALRAPLLFSMAAATVAAGIITQLVGPGAPIGPNWESLARYTGATGIFATAGLLFRYAAAGQQASRALR